MKPVYKLLVFFTIFCVIIEVMLNCFEINSIIERTKNLEFRGNVLSFFASKKPQPFIFESPNCIKKYNANSKLKFYELYTRHRSFVCDERIVLFTDSRNFKIKAEDLFSFEGGGWKFLVQKNIIEEDGHYLNYKVNPSLLNVFNYLKYSLLCGVVLFTFCLVFLRRYYIKSKNIKLIIGYKEICAALILYLFSFYVLYFSFVLSISNYMHKILQ